MKSLSGQAAPYNTAMYSVKGNQKIFEGFGAQNVVSAGAGVTQYQGFTGPGAPSCRTPAKCNYGGGVPGPSMEAIDRLLTTNRSTSIYADTYVKAVEMAMNRTSKLARVLETAVLTTSCNHQEKGLGGQFAQVARIIKKRTELGHERAAFYVTEGGFDTHGSSGGILNDKLEYAINPALRAFVCEMKAQGAWDDVAVVTLSDFGRSVCLPLALPPPWTLGA